MRRLSFLVVLVLLVFAAGALAEEETLFKGNVERGGFGGPVVKYTSIHGQGAVIVGGRGGWVVNHWLVLGGGGYGVATEVNAPDESLPEEAPLDIEFGYGGFEMEYILHPNSLVHFTLCTLIGGGANNFVKDVGAVGESNQHVGESDVVFVLEPAAGVELNVTTWFRLNAGASYRLVTGVNQVGLGEDDFCGATATATFKFGRF